ncbi:peroxisomal and mitochondrial division factor 1-like [Impatiens glandulifera]|uniref:peroxisomal and mitochondrial division factor 1-like n=1 Tax=Impatiens glandulifera TaxID=253017 RepID=UPI001FB0F0EC|nr:peroxisomal and mitochondrial division factor 1-like [Impatiens glandulifera]XP_047330373.1 peroxisomal and mitochondrial division factor 1-like [Impatiens glandulifera]
MVNEAPIEGDERTVDIAGNDDRDEDFVDFDDNNGNASFALSQKFEALELEKRELTEENESMINRIEKLKAEIQGLENDKGELKKVIEVSEADKKVLESTAARAAELETEVSRLQRDLISSNADGEEVGKDLFELRKAMEELKKSELEKSLKLDVLEKERNSLVERIHKDADGVKEAKALTDARVREMEKKIEGLEQREVREKSDRITIEQETKAKLDEKDGEIRRLKTQVEDLESISMESSLELERLNKEREELEIVKNELEAHLKKSERKVKEMGRKADELVKELESSERMMIALKEKRLDMNGTKSSSIDDSRDQLELSTGWELQWPVVVAASTGASIAAVAAVYYLRSAKLR